MSKTETKSDREVLDEGIKVVSTLKFILAGVVALVAFGVATASYWKLPSAVAEHTAKIHALESHHAIDEVRLGNIERSQTWTQDTMFKFAEKIGVANMRPTPLPDPLPTPNPIDPVAP